MELRIRSIFFQTCKKKKYNSHEYLIYFSQSWEIFQRWINLEWKKKEVWCKGCNYLAIGLKKHETPRSKLNEICNPFASSLSKAVQNYSPQIQHPRFLYETWTWNLEPVRAKRQDLMKAKLESNLADPLCQFRSET